MQINRSRTKIYHIHLCYSKNSLNYKMNPHRRCYISISRIQNLLRHHLLLLLIILFQACSDTKIWRLYISAFVHDVSFRNINLFSYFHCLKKIRLSYTSAPPSRKWYHGTKLSWCIFQFCLSSPCYLAHGTSSVLFGQMDCLPREYCPNTILDKRILGRW